MKVINTNETTANELSPMEREWVYNGLDTCVTYEVLEALLPQLDEVTSKTYEFSLALQGPVLDMRLRGVMIDQERKADVIEELFEKISVLELNLERIVLDGLGLFGFNWRSNNDLQHLFYHQLSIPPILNKGRPTVNRTALEKLSNYFVALPFVNHIIAIRELAKKIAVLRQEIDSDGRIRTSYNIAGTSTGRFSSSFSEFGTGGNLQNIEESLRSILIADPKMKFAKFDAKSGESFIVGAIEWNLFGDDRYLVACESGDPHTAVAKICWPTLPWTGDLKKDKAIAEEPFYRHYTYRFMCKKLGHGCLTEDHEVLTPAGWVPITVKPPVIMAFSETKSEFQQVSRWVDYPYTGILQSFEGNSISLLATADHRIPYKKDVRYGLCEAPASNGPGAKMPLGFGWLGGGEEVPARLIAAFMCDGTIDKYNLSFHFAKEWKVNRLTELLTSEDIEFNLYLNKDSTYKITIPKFDWPKRPGSFMFNWTLECLEDFLDELKWWDGWTNTVAVTISSKHKEDLIWYQTFGRLIGIGGNIQKPQISGFGTTMYRLQQNNRKWASGPSIAWNKILAKDIRVLCPSVPSAWFYVRRNGKIFVTGNSNYGGMPKTLSEQTKLPLDIVTEFQPRYFKAFPAHREWQNWVDQQIRINGTLTTLTGRRRQFWGRRNDPDTLREAIAYGPQGSLADIVNRAMLRIWRKGIAIVMLQDHDALTFMYPEKDEDSVVPVLQSMLSEDILLNNGRILRIPYDCKVGWNKGEFSATNPDGLKDYTGHDERKRSPVRDILDRKWRKHG